MTDQYVFLEITELDEINSFQSDLERLIILRKRLNFKQYEMARALNVSYSYYGQVESGKFPLTDLLKKKINNFLLKENKNNDEDLFSQHQ